MCHAQQLPVYSGYLHNPYLINPAVTGYDLYMDISLQAKKQWAGLDAGPFNQIITVHSSINENNYGFGGGIFDDELGTLRNSGFLASGAYHLMVGEETKLGFGVTGRFNFYSINQAKLIVQDNNDLLLMTNPKSGLTPDLSFGFLLHRYDYFIGISLQNVLASNANLGGFSLYDIRHFNFLARWSLQLNESIGLTPGVYVSYINGFSVYGDIRLLMDYEEKFVFELGFKTNLDLVLGIGMEIIEDLKVNYNYDLVLSGMSGSTWGSHELVISYDFYYNPAYKVSKPRYKWIRKYKSREE